MNEHYYSVLGLLFNNSNWQATDLLFPSELVLCIWLLMLSLSNFELSKIMSVPTWKLGVICVCVCVCVCLVTQLCLTLCDLMDYSPPGSSVHGDSPSKNTRVVAIPFFKGSSQPRDKTQVLCIAVRFFTIWATREALARIWVNFRAVADRWFGTLQSVQMRELFWKWATIALTSFFILLWISFSLLLFFSEMSPN